MGDGKRVVWELIQLAAAGDRSIFAKVVAEWGGPAAQRCRRRCALNMSPGLPRRFALGEGSTMAENPYHAAASMLAQTMGVRCSRATLLRFMPFVGDIDRGSRSC